MAYKIKIKIENSISNKIKVAICEYFFCPMSQKKRLNF